MKCFLETMIVVNTKAKNFMGIDGGPHKPQARRNRWPLGRAVPPPLLMIGGVFYNVKNGSSFITSKSLSENLSNHNKHFKTKRE